MFDYSVLYVLTPECIAPFCASKFWGLQERLCFFWAELAAKAVKVEVFGGDAIVTPVGKIYIIDINSWPSFARVRAEASVQIARRLRLRLRQVAGKKR